MGHATTGSGLGADEATEELLGHRRQQHRPTERWRKGSIPRTHAGSVATLAKFVGGLGVGREAVVEKEEES